MVLNSFKSLPARLRAGAGHIDRFLARYLDSEGVVLFQALVYSCMFLAGLYGLFVSQGVPGGLATEIPNGSWTQKAWLGLYCMGVLTLVGRWLVGRYQGNNAGLYTSGAWLQFTGDLAMTWGFAGYVIATSGTFFWGKELIAAFGFTAYALCAFFLAVRDIRRIMQAERDVRR